MSDAELPEPFAPPDADCRQLDGFMLNVERLLSSELWALSSGDEFKAALALWCRAWKQVPAGSLPDNDKVLATFSGAGKRWSKVREMALHGFVKCLDGRLYHPVLCEDVRRAIQRQAEFQQKRERDAERLRKWREQRGRNGDETRFATGNETVLSHSNSTGTGTGQGRDRDVRKEEDSDPNGSGAGAPSADPVKAMFDRAVAILGERSRSLVGKARKEHGDLAVLAAIAACEEENPSDPAAFFVRALAARAKRPNGGLLPNEGVF